MPKTRVLISQLLVPFKKTSSLVSGALGGVGLLAGLRKIVELDVNQLLAGLLSFYDSNVRVPVKWILDQTGIALPPLAPDILLVFVLFGIACTRSLLSVYEPTKDGYVVKGVWGLLSRWIFSFSKGSPNAVTWAIYQVLAVVLWPVIARTKGSSLCKNQGVKS